MNDESNTRFEARLREWVADYQEPPATPRDAMWAVIAARRAERRQARRPAGWVRWGVGLAATLAIGIALGRMSAPDVPAAADRVAEAASDPAVRSVAYDVTARNHLGQVETFLNVFRTEARAGRLDGAFGPTARHLAMQNRLLLQSPAADDPAIRQLLGDIELVLAQIRQYAATGSDDELDFIDDGIERRAVLLKLRSVAAHGAT